MCPVMLKGGLRQAWLRLMACSGTPAWIWAAQQANLATRHANAQGLFSSGLAGQNADSANMGAAVQAYGQRAALGQRIAA